MSDEIFYAVKDDLLQHLVGREVMFYNYNLGLYKGTLLEIIDIKLKKYRFRLNNDSRIRYVVFDDVIIYN